MYHFFETWPYRILKNKTLKNYKKISIAPNINSVNLYLVLKT